jgi:hypothetical protein
MMVGGSSGCRSDHSEGVKAEEEEGKTARGGAARVKMPPSGEQGPGLG